MVLILSEDKDYTTNIVIDWIDRLGSEFIRINPTNEIKIKSIDIDKKDFELEININGKIKTLKSKDISSYWYRRGSLKEIPYNIEISNKYKKVGTLIHEINLESRQEYQALIETLNYCFENNVKSIGAYFHNSTNKLINLIIAKELGIDIPDSKVISEKKELIKFFNKHKRIISKQVGQGSAYGYNSQLEGFTVLIAKKDIDSFPDHFHPTLFQECLNKKYELRVFYLNHKCYSMSIFSQNDKQTKVDFRNYNNKKPNRTIPFNLPYEVQEKIDQLMCELGMNSGSIDIIYTQEDKFVFLEINPVGQFNQVSYPCNYHLEKIIAEQLTT